MRGAECLPAANALRYEYLAIRRRHKSIAHPTVETHFRKSRYIGIGVSLDPGFNQDYVTDIQHIDAV